MSKCVCKDWTELERQCAQDMTLAVRARHWWGKGYVRGYRHHPLWGLVEATPEGLPDEYQPDYRRGYERGQSEARRVKPKVRI